MIDNIFFALFLVIEHLPQHFRDTLTQMRELDLQVHSKIGRLVYCYQSLFISFPAKTTWTTGKFG